MTNPNRFDRRKFLASLGSAALALPMLEAFMPRVARAQTVAPPKRLLIIFHQDGRLMGDGLMSGGQRNDWWSPAAAGPLPVGAPPSQLLAALQAVRNEVVTIDGIDNIVRHLYSDQDSHTPAHKSLLTCRKAGTGGTGGMPAAPSFDYVMGQRLRAPGSTAPASMVMLGTAADFVWRANNVDVFFGANGTPAWVVAPNPAAAISELFGAPMGGPRNPRPTLAQRLASERKSVLDGALDNFNALRGRVNASDRARLDSHAEFVRGLERAAAGGGAGDGGGGGGGSADAGAGGGEADAGAGGGAGGGGGGVTPSLCQRPSESSVASNNDPSGSAYLRGERDAVMIPAIIENLVQAFACDVTRVMSLHFWQGDAPVFPTEFSGTSPFLANNWHGVIHSTPRIHESAASLANAQSLKASFNLYASVFTTLVQRMANYVELDGSRMLDNTLVLWVSEMGYGAVHKTYNLPVVLAGLRRAFPQGQGRHVVQNRRTMGDLLAHVMRLFGGTDATFGETGTLGSHGGPYTPDAGWASTINANTPLHQGPLDL